MIRIPDGGAGAWKHTQWKDRTLRIHVFWTSKHETEPELEVDETFSSQSPPPPNDVLPPAKPHHLKLPEQCHQLDSNVQMIGTMGNISHLNYCRALQEWPVLNCVWFGLGWISGPGCSIVRKEEGNVKRRFRQGKYHRSPDYPSTRNLVQPGWRSGSSSDHPEVD